MVPLCGSPPPPAEIGKLDEDSSCSCRYLSTWLDKASGSLFPGKVSRLTGFETHSNSSMRGSWSMGMGHMVLSETLTYCGWRVYHQVSSLMVDVDVVLFCWLLCGNKGHAWPP